MKKILGGYGDVCTFKCTNGETFTCSTAYECAQKAGNTNYVMPSCECVNQGCS